MELHDDSQHYLLDPRRHADNPVLPNGRDKDVEDDEGRSSGTPRIMIESVTIPNPETASAIRRIQWLTVGWTIEVGIAFVAALRAHSVALAAFGGDSAIDLL